MATKRSKLQEAWDTIAAELDPAKQAVLLIATTGTHGHRTLSSIDGALFLCTSKPLEGGEQLWQSDLE